MFVLPSMVFSFMWLNRLFSLFIIRIGKISFARFEAHTQLSVYLSTSRFWNAATKSKGGCS